METSESPDVTRSVETSALDLKLQPTSTEKEANDKDSSDSSSSSSDDSSSQNQSGEGKPIVAVESE